MLNAFSQKPHPWGVEREERDAHKDGGGQKEVSPLIKIGFSTFGMKYWDKVTEKVVSKTLISWTCFAVVSSKRFASF